MNLDNNIINILSSYKKIFVAFSGGIDSSVLLHLLINSSLLKQAELFAVHINHKIHPQSKDWVIHCKKFCNKFCIKFIVKNITETEKFNNKILFKKISDFSPEERLRFLRYFSLEKVLDKNSCLVTGHNANDQAETVLLRLTRGSGIKGISSIHLSTKTLFSKKKLIRPLLKFTRKEIVEYAKNNNISWITDDSNFDTKFDRNYIRCKLLPIMEKRWPQIVKTLCNVAYICQKDQELLKIFAKNDIKKALIDNKNNKLDINIIKSFTINRQINILRYWLENIILFIPSKVIIYEIIKTIIYSKHDAQPEIKWKNAKICRFRNELHCIIKEKSTKNIKNSNLPRWLVENLKSHNIDFKDLIITKRIGGEKVRLNNDKYNRKLKKLMQGWNIPVWERNNIPIIKYRNEIIIILGYYCHSKFSAILPYLSKYLLQN